MEIDVIVRQTEVRKFSRQGFAPCMMTYSNQEAVIVLVSMVYFISQEGA